MTASGDYDCFDRPESRRLFEYIEVYYNRQQRHCYQSCPRPVEYEGQQASQ